MSKLKTFARVLKYFIKTSALIMLQIIKFILVHVPSLVREIFRSISKRLRFSITFKTTITYTVIFSTILLVLGTALTCGFGLFLLCHTNKSLERNSQVITAIVSQSTEIPQNEIKDYADIENIVVILFDRQANIIYTTSQEAFQWNPAFRARINPTTSIDHYLHFENEVTLNNGISKIEVSQSLAEQTALLLGLTAILAISFLLAVLITVLIGSRTSRKMLRPIDNMTRTAKSISIGDLHTRLDVVDSHDELKDLAVTFNEMLDRIQTSVEQQNTFVSDASHELRTPIAVIQGYANLLQRWGKEDKAVLQESIDAIKSESHYMQELVEKLLFLASADKKKQKLDIKPFALSELINEVLKETKLIDSDHNMINDTNEIITFNGDRGLIKQSLRIFIDNGIKYTPIGGSITLNSILKGNLILITIEDTGKGISEEDLPYIFNRFYKADKSRTRENGGAGLGLSIARWIIEQHQGDIKVESILNKGTKVIITLPA
jgi:signal transduction histidine kinase